MFTLILTLSMCALLLLMIWAATYFYPWTGLLRFFPQDIEEKARQHKPPFPAAPVIGWIIMLLCIRNGWRRSFPDCDFRYPAANEKSIDREGYEI